MDVITRRGWNHSGCGPWTTILAVPMGWRVVTRGKARATDKCLVATAAGCRKAMRRRAKNLLRQKDTLIPSKWEKTNKRDVGIEVKEFRAVIRKAD